MALLAQFNYLVLLIDIDGKQSQLNKHTSLLNNYLIPFFKSMLLLDFVIPLS